MIFHDLRGTNRLMPVQYCSGRSRLPQNEWHIYDRVIEAMAQRQCSAAVGSMSLEDAERIVSAIADDQPFLYDFDRGAMTLSRSLAGSRLNWKFRLSDTEAEKTDRQIIDQLRSMNRRMKDAETLLDREKIIHDLLVGGMKIRKIPDTEQDTWEHHRIVGPLIRREAVCEGMAYLFRLLCIMQQIPCVMIRGWGFDSSGQSERHAWNLITLGQYTLHVDTYWDLCRYDPESGIGYDYFNIDDQAAAKDHSWETSMYPVCRKERFSYFAEEKCDVSSKKEMEALVRRNYQEGKMNFTVRILSGLKAEDCQKMVSERYFAGRGGTLSMRVNKTQQVIHYSVQYK